MNGSLFLSLYILQNVLRITWAVETAHWGLVATSLAPGSVKDPVSMEQGREGKDA